MTEWIPVDLLSFEFVKILVLMVLIDSVGSRLFCNGLFRLSGSFPGGVRFTVFGDNRESSGSRRFSAEGIFDQRGYRYFRLGCLPACGWKLLKES